MTLDIIDEGIKEYVEMLEEQRRRFNEMVNRKKAGLPTEEEVIYMVEHPDVITLGKHANESNLLINEEDLNRRGIQVHHIERGGDVTYHGPGQLVAYPIIDLEAHHLGVKDYVSLLEEAVILTISDFGIKGERVPGASGVWIEVGGDRERKICALGVKCSRYITMHGLALNVNTNLDGFRLINPCGFIDKGVTSIAAEVHKQVDIRSIKDTLAKNLLLLLGYE
ncbi:MAG: lipoyl(octanoyl) transferase LipB, partial [Muribaculaceae bacterium]|nr:lipoyl(octanoyl) transferase LipB [Muribaculaceae bacterium]